MGPNVELGVQLGLAQAELELKAVRSLMFFQPVHDKNCLLVTIDEPGQRHAGRLRPGQQPLGQLRLGGKGRVRHQTDRLQRPVTT